MGDMWVTLQEWYAQTQIYKFVVEWQTGIAALIALIGAYWTVKAVRAQIAQAEVARLQTERLALETRRREDRAAAAALPIALSELMDYCTRCIQAIDAYISIPSGDRPQVPTDFPLPAVPPGVVEALQACVRHAEPSNVDNLVKVLGKLQVQSSRMNSFIERSRGNIMGTIEGLDNMRWAADLYAAASVLFEYSRDDDLVGQTAPYNQLRSALRLSGIIDTNHPIFEHIQPRPRT